MKLNPRLNQLERIGSTVIGVGMLVLAFLGIDQLWIRIALSLLGIVFIVGGLGGT